jgi:hypothetical protein
LRKSAAKKTEANQEHNQPTGATRLQETRLNIKKTKRLLGNLEGAPIQTGSSTVKFTAAATNERKSPRETQAAAPRSTEKESAYTASELTRRMGTGNGRKSETAQENETQRENLSSRNPCRAGRFCAGTRRKAEQQIKSVPKAAATKRKSLQDETLPWRNALNEQAKGILATGW